MRFGEWKAQLVDKFGYKGKAFYLYVDKGSERIFLTQDGTRVVVQEGSRLEDDKILFAVFDDDSLQAIVDAFANAGIKPSEASKTEGLLVATERHLDDMRALVFKTKRKGSGDA